MEARWRRHKLMQDVERKMKTRCRRRDGVKREGRYTHKDRRKME